MLCVDRESWFIFVTLRYYYGAIPGTFAVMDSIASDWFRDQKAEGLVCSTPE